MTIIMSAIICGMLYAFCEIEEYKMKKVEAKRRAESMKMIEEWNN